MGMPGTLTKSVLLTFPVCDTVMLSLKCVQAYFFSVTDILCLPVPNPWQFSLYLKRLLYHPTIFRVELEFSQLLE